MDLYQKQQFGFLLQTATERFAARLEERFRGADQALKLLQENPEADGVWLTDFTAAVFEDFLLNNIAGACFVLQALAARPMRPQEGGAVETVLVTLAKQLFAELLLQKSIESLEQHSSYQSS